MICKPHGRWTTIIPVVETLADGRRTGAGRRAASPGGSSLSHLGRDTITVISKLKYLLLSKSNSPEDCRNLAKVTQGQRYIIHLFLRGYKTLVNYCLKCCPETEDHAVCLSRAWRHEATGQASLGVLTYFILYSFSFIDFTLAGCSFIAIIPA